MKNKTSKAFTLVELIVVITILAILGTIAFISLSGYSASSRDSVRISDVSNMKTSLELFHLDAGKYPLPDDDETVTYSGETLWYQGTFGSDVVSQLSRNLNEIPTDTLTDKEYIFSTANNKNEFEILTLLEGDIVLNTISKTNAATLIVTPRIDGNYNGVFIKTSKNIVPIPSIITAENVSTGGIILNNTNIKSQVTNLGKNIPNIGNINSSTGQLTGLLIKEIPVPFVDASPTVKASVITLIQEAYAGCTELVNNNIYEYILSISGELELAGVFDTVILNKNTAVQTTTTTYSCIGTVPTLNVTKTNDTGLTVDTTWQTTTSGNDCYYECSGGYTGTNCEIPNPYVSCTGVNTPTPFSATTTYGSCNTADIIVCSENGTGYTIAACNVGTNTAATSYNDTNGYGGLFQWGNHYDFRGGQFTNGNVYPTTSTTQVSTITNYSTYSNGTFIKKSDWTSLDIDGALRSANWNPCNVGYHVPSYTEWSNIFTAIGNTQTSYGITNELRLPAAGIRDRSNANTYFHDTISFYWTSSPYGTNYAYIMFFNSTNVYISNSYFRADGYSVRCFKN